MKRVVIGILAHVDAGKTTLSESILYSSGVIKNFGRVDHKNTYLDTYSLEKSRGITIFSKSACFCYKDFQINLIDTPGHVDFSPETERALQILDYAILVVSATDGIEPHTITMWELLGLYNIPTFIFVNKMDRVENKQCVLNQIKKQFNDNCIEFDSFDIEFYEKVALCDDNVMKYYLDNDNILEGDIKNLIRERKLFPLYFGSALYREGVTEFLNGMCNYMLQANYPDKFGAKVFKITNDENTRLTHIKLTGGELNVKDTLEISKSKQKIHDIRVYSGSKYSSVQKVVAGDICALVGIKSVFIGDGLGFEKGIDIDINSALTYKILLPDEVDAKLFFNEVKILEEEEPTLKIYWNEIDESIYINILGDVQLEIIKHIIYERFSIDIEFGIAEIIYKETVNSASEGVAHFEPLKHFAEVYLRIEPNHRGAGIQIYNECSDDMLDKNYQHSILNFLNTKSFVGVLTGSKLTDVKITLLGGKAHKKHTSSGDFIQASIRALRQGLMENESVLLEPYYKFKIELLESMVGKLMTDISNMGGKCVIDSNIDGNVVVVGKAPVSHMMNYQSKLTSYTKGKGKIFLSLDGYDICNNAVEIIQKIDYKPFNDIENPMDSIFCANGVAFTVAYNEVKSYLGIKNFKDININEDEQLQNAKKSNLNQTETLSLEEIDKIINSTYYSNSGKKNKIKNKKTAIESYYDNLEYKSYNKPKHKKNGELVIVDGYNIIYSWDRLNHIAKDSMQSARNRLISILANYQALRKCKIVLVFDAHLVRDGLGMKEEYPTIEVVYTKADETADQYIEKYARDKVKDYKVIVATSDGLIQTFTRSIGAELLSSNDLKEIIQIYQDKLDGEYLQSDMDTKIRLDDILSDEQREKIKQIFK